MAARKHRSFLAPQPGVAGVAMVAPWWRTLVGSALAAGACRWRVRTSARSFSGAVVQVGFRRRQAAIIFARAWGGWCGCKLALRRRISSGRVVWAVSVPVNWPGARAAATEPVHPIGPVTWVARGW